MIVRADIAASASRMRTNGAEVRMPLDANSVNQRDHAALVKRTVSGDRVEAAVMLPASEPNVLRWRKDRKANAWSSEARAGVPPAAGCIVQGKQG